MLKRILACLGFLLVQSTLLPFCEAEQIELVDYLPVPAELQSWIPEDEPRIAEGETLFMLINGAAELYHEYGFKRAIFQSYAQGDEWIDLEIYEMEDAAAAYGLQSIKQGNNGKVLEIGQEAVLEEYYLNFRKGNVQVSVVGQDDSEATIEALLKIAGVVETRISGSGEAPELIRLLKEAGVSPGYSVYIKGQIGLFNYLPVSLESIAGFEEGAIAGYDDFTLALLAYPSSEEAASSFKHTAEALQQDLEPSFAGEQELSVVLDNGIDLSLLRVRSYIIAIFGEDVQQAKPLISEIETLLK